MSEQPHWVTIVLGLMSTFQTVALAFMASRSRRVRRDDEPGAHEAP